MGGEFVDDFCHIARLSLRRVRLFNHSSSNIFHFIREVRNAQDKISLYFFIPLNTKFVIHNVKQPDTFHH